MSSVGGCAVEADDLCGEDIGLEEMLVTEEFVDETLLAVTKGIGNVGEIID